MYQRLSPKAKKHISKKDFVKRYQNIYDSFDIRHLTIKANFKTDKDNDHDDDKKVNLPFTAKMDTMAGPVKFSEKAQLTPHDNKDKDKDWYLDWHPKMIFPQIKDQDTKVYSKTLSPKRGEIKGRNGKPLAANGSVISIGIWPGKLKDDSKKKLASKTDLSVKDIDKKLDASWVKDDSFVPITKLAATNSKKGKQLTSIPGVQKREDDARVYPDKKAAGPLTGYIGGITAEQYKKHKDKGYDKNDTLGQSGLEQVYEDRLRGKDGAEIYTADADGKKQETIAKKEPKDGETIQLTIDASLQKSLYLEMKNKGKRDAGTAAAIDPKTGQVLALVSSPTYDPNDFILGVTTKQWKQWQNDKKQPLLNRFAQSYAPGSTFKPITAAIALKTDAINPDKKRRIKGQTWQPKGHGWGKYKVKRVNTTPRVDMEDALVYSDDIYFAQAALNIGDDKFLKTAKRFGLGEKLSFPYPLEKSVVTDGKNFDSEIQLADSGYGQGHVSVSALQLALAYTPFVNDGNMLAPTLELKKAKGKNHVWHKNAISSDHAKRIRKDLRKVVSSPHGTAHAADIDHMSIAGKTGTAELKKSKKEKHGDENGWFVGFDEKHPKLLVAMMVENVQDKNPHGSSYVVPKVTDVLEDYAKKHN